jgi:hypothetical protein
MVRRLMLGDMVGISQVNDYAADNGVGQHVAAIRLNSPLAQKAHFWPDVKKLTECKKIEAPNLTCSERGDLLTEYSKYVGGYIRFPSSTVFLHGLGVIASALTKSFSIDYGFDDSIPVNLYVATAQPPSTGKSSVNKAFLVPILKSYKKLNDLHEDDRKKLQREIKRIEKKLEAGKVDGHEETELIDMLESKQEKLNKIPEWKGAISNATVESLENVAEQNGGMWNIVSAESDGLNVAVGSVYGDSGSKKNIEILLKSWDGEWFSSERIGRNGYHGDVRASIAVLAQDDTLDTMLAAGESGRGLTERFLMLSEKPMLGHRDHESKPVHDKVLKARYESFINNVIMEDSVQLNFSHDAEENIKSYKCGLEPKMRDGGEYSNNLLTGFIGKADKQIRKIAAVLHCIDNWQDGGQRSHTVTDDYTVWAIALFDELSKTFVSAADFMGYAGSSSEVQKMSTVLTELAGKNKIKVNFTVVRDKVRNVKPFRGSRNVAEKLISDVLPKMQELNYCVIDGQTIYINPRLK